MPTSRRRARSRAAAAVHPARHPQVAVVTAARAAVIAVQAIQRPPAVEASVVVSTDAQIGAAVAEASMIGVTGTGKRSRNETGTEIDARITTTAVEAAAAAIERATDGIESRADLLKTIEEAVASTGLRGTVAAGVTTTAAAAAADGEVTGRDPAPNRAAATTPIRTPNRTPLLPRLIHANATRL